MAIAKKCDRCGKFYEHYPTGNKWQWNAIQKIQRNIAGETIAKNDLIDLCPECVDKFEKFMTAKFQEEEKMLKIENTEVVGWEAAIRGMRNPMNSWEKGDSNSCGTCGDCDICVDYENCPFGHDGRKFLIGNNDLALMRSLSRAGTDHRKFMRMITVYLDITAPLYWWKEFDTYKVGTVANSCSTMHKIAAKEFTLEDFSHEHLLEGSDVDWGDVVGKSVLEHVIFSLNVYRGLYLSTKDKKYWWQMIQLLPSSYNQRRTVMLNYEVLANIYKSRRNHKLDEWHTLCDWIESLPYSELITGKEKK